MADPIDKGILIVEDDPDLRSILAEVLSVNDYSKVYQAENIAQCLSVLSERGEQIYVVLLDLMLPDGNGLNIIEHLVNSYTYIVGVIVITGFGDAESARQFFRLGTPSVITVDFHAKPFELEPLLEQISRTVSLIDSKRKRQSTLIHDEIWLRLDSIEAGLNTLNDRTQQLDTLRQIENKLAQLEKNSPSFLKELGMDVLRLIIIGFAVFAFLYLDLGSAILRAIQLSK